ncbi:MAG: hypothetical protein AB7P02_19930 [Alphaproteobacteria bacterium]
MRALDGANLFAAGRCITLTVDWGDGLQADVARLDAALSALVAHPAMAAAPPPPGHATRKDRPDRAVAWIAAGLQRTLGHRLPALRGGLSSRLSDRIVVPVWDPAIGRDAAVAAFRLVAAILSADDDGAAAAVARTLDVFGENARMLALPESETRLVAAAERRGIPWRRLVPDRVTLAFGDGARQMRTHHTFSPVTSHLASVLSTRKDVAAELLRGHGLPVPANHLVGTVDGAIRAAEVLGWPVVVKPNTTDHGTAVSVGVRDRDEMREAFAAAVRHGAVLVEQQIAGDHTRLLVIHGRFVSAVTQVPARVTGDGARSVAALVAAVNAGRTDVLSHAFKKIVFDDEAHRLLARQGLTPADVPQAGRTVVLRHTSNTSRGGTATNVTASVHPDNIRLAEQAARVIGLDVAGIDLITPDIARSHREVGGAICEINPTPGFFMREPGFLVEDAFLDGWFSGGADGRIPVVCVLDDEGAAGRAFSGLRARMPGVAFAARGVTFVGDWQVPVPGADASRTTRIVLADPATRAAVVAVASRGVVETGLGFDRCTVAIVASFGGDDPAGRLARQLLDRASAAVVRSDDAAGLAAAIERVVAAAGG